MTAIKKSALLLLLRHLVREPEHADRNQSSFPNNQRISYSYLTSDLTLKNHTKSVSTLIDNNNPASPSISENRILIVDDEPDLAELFKIILESSGFNVDVYNDPELALSNYRVGHYGLLLLDVKMPKMNGFELYQKIKNKDEKAKVCFITAFEEYYSKFIESFPNLEVDCFIRKPIPLNELVKIVKSKLNCYS